MILDTKALAWQLRVQGSAYAHGWTVFRQEPPKRSQEQAQPSLILVKGHRTLAVYLRLKVRRDRMPPAAAWSQATGVEAVVWTPDRWTEIVAELRGAPADELPLLRKVYGKAASRGVILAGMSDASTTSPAAPPPTRLHPDLRPPDQLPDDPGSVRNR